MLLLFLRNISSCSTLTFPTTFYTKWCMLRTIILFQLEIIKKTWIKRLFTISDLKRKKPRCETYKGNKRVFFNPHLLYQDVSVAINKGLLDGELVVRHFSSSHVALRFLCSVICLVSSESRGDPLDHAFQCKPKIHVVIIASSYYLNLV